MHYTHACTTHSTRTCTPHMLHAHAQHTHTLPSAANFSFHALKGGLLLGPPASTVRRSLPSCMRRLIMENGLGEVQVWDLRLISNGNEEEARAHIRLHTTSSAMPKDLPRVSGFSRIRGKHKDEIDCWHAQPGSIHIRHQDTSIISITVGAVLAAQPPLTL